MSNGGKYIKKLREQAQLSKRALSKLTNISHTEIARIENNIRVSPSIEHLKVIAKALKIHYLELYHAFNIIEEADGIKSLNYYSTEELLVEVLKRINKNI